MSEPELQSPLARHLLETVGPTLDEGSGDDLVAAINQLESAHAAEQAFADRGRATTTEEGQTMKTNARTLSEHANDVAEMDDAALDAYYESVVAPHLHLNARAATKYDTDEDRAYAGFAAQIGIRDAQSLRGNE